MNLEAAIELYANRKLHYRTMFQGIPISVENKKGSIRRGTSPEWGPWETKMRHPYGYVRGTKKMGMDGAELDVFMGPNKLAKNAYVIMIRKAPDFRKDDEQKIMLGFDSAEAAKQALLKHFDDPRFFGRSKTMSMHEFRKWVMRKPIKLAANLGEPNVYDGGYAHIEPLPSYHAPSLKNPKRVPSDSPGETDDSFGDVTRRKAAATKARRDSLTKQHTDSGMHPLSSTQVSGFPFGTVGGFG